MPSPPHAIHLHSRTHSLQSRLWGGAHPSAPRPIPSRRIIDHPIQRVWSGAMQGGGSRRRRCARHRHHPKRAREEVALGGLFDDRRGRGARGRDEGRRLDRRLERRDERRRRLAGGDGLRDRFRHRRRRDRRGRILAAGGGLVGGATALVGADEATEAEEAALDVLEWRATAVASRRRAFCAAACCCAREAVRPASGRAAAGTS